MPAIARPNIALFVADDIPRNMLGAYGATHNLSPSIDSLARDGIVFDRAFTTAPLCTPSRFSLITGRFASNASSIPAHRPWSMVGFNTFLNGNEPTVAARLSRAGYSTCFCGKYHMGFPLSQAGKMRGRAKFGGSGRGLSYQDMVEAVRKYGGFDEVVSLWGGNKQTAQSPHNPEWMAAQAVNFIHRVAATTQPFFLYFAGTVPHSPFGLPYSFEVNVTQTPSGPVPYVPSWEARRQALLQKLIPLGLICKDYRQCHRLQYPGAEGAKVSDAYQQPVALSNKWLDGNWLYSEPNFEQGRLARLFSVGLAWLDDSIGTVMAALRTDRMRRSTIVVYTADHGASFLGKGHAYEAGIRVPLIVSWLSHGTERTDSTSIRRSNAPVMLIDVAPTLLAAAGADTGNADLHGLSFLPFIPRRLMPHHAMSRTFSNAVPTGEMATTTWDSRPVFIEIGYARAVIRSAWKLIVINDPIDRCRDPSDGSCRNLHGEVIDSYQCNFTANGHMGNRLVGACNMTYDAVARHARFCDRRQLYNIESDPLEQNNLVHEHPSLYKELLALILEHVHEAEPGNPAVANRTPNQCSQLQTRSSRGTAIA